MTCRTLVALLALALAACVDPVAPARPRLVEAHASITVTDLVQLHRPDIAAPVPVVLWLHPGGWRQGTHLLAPSAPELQLLKDSIAVASVAYRLSGQAKWPAQMLDIQAAVDWLASVAPSLGLDVSHLGVWGYSAGAHLAAMAAVSCGVWGPWCFDAAVTWSAPTDLLREDAQLAAKGCPSPRANVVGSQEYDLLGFLPWADTVATNLASPLSYLSSDDPPFLIFHGAYDCTVPPQQSAGLSNRLTALGVSAPRFLYQTTHAATVFRSDSSIARVRDFFRQHLRP